MKYKENFENQNGRTLAVTKDLAPILSEFNQYKNLKNKIKFLTQKMKKLEDN